MSRTSSYIRAALVSLGLAGFAVVAVGCGVDPGSSPKHFTSASDLPPELADLRRRKSEFLDTGTGGFERTIAAHRGYPIVVSRWASWCGPCLYEIPILARSAERLSRSVAFVGVNYNDSEGSARDTLRRTPLPYPSFSDRDGSVSKEFTDTTYLPATAFYDRKGKLEGVHYGPYEDVDSLIADVHAYTDN